MWFSIFDPRYSPAKHIQTCLNQSKVHAKQHDLPFDRIETYTKCIDLLFELRKGYAKWYDTFFDLKNVHAESIVHLFELKKDHAKRYIGHFCRGVLHTPSQDIPKRNVWSENKIHVGRMQYAPTLTDEKSYF